MIHYTESMTGLIVTSCGTVYMLTGNRYFDIENFTYWYETCEDVWIIGDSMKYADGRIK